MSDSLKILVTTSSFCRGDKAPLDLLSEKGLDVVLNPFGRTLMEDEIFELISDVDGIIAGTEPLTKEVIRNAGRLRVISRCGSGINNVDVEFAKQRSIRVYATESPKAAVAEFALGLILDALRGISNSVVRMKKGRWEKHMGQLLQGKTVGIVGMGHIGKKLTVLLKPFNCRILAFDPIHDEVFSRKHKVTYTNLNKLLKNSAIVSLHLPLNEKTKNLFNMDTLSKFKKNSIIVNTSRGGIINEDDLYSALKEGTIDFACLDVFEKEPYSGKLFELDNVILTPHIGGYAKEERVSMELQAVNNLLKGLGLE